MNHSNLVDLDRYPIDALDRERGQAMALRLRETLREDGLCRLGGFLKSDAVDRLIAEVQSLEASAYHGLKAATPYFNAPDPNFPDNHPRNITTLRQVGIIAADLMPPECGLVKLYQWDNFKDFVAALLESVNTLVMPGGRRS